jgi:hypothetical protein
MDMGNSRAKNDEFIEAVHRCQETLRITSRSGSTGKPHQKAFRNQVSERFTAELW